MSDCAKKRLRVAQIGISSTTHASQVFQSLVNHPDTFDVIGYANVDGDHVTRAAAYERYTEMDADEILKRDDLDAVVIECDEIHQTEWAIKAAERGLPIHLEKPASEDDVSFAKLMDIVEEKKLVFSRGYMYRFNPAFEHLLSLYESGELGEITSVHAEMSCIHPEGMRRWMKAFRGGMMFYLGCHLVDLVYRLAGMPDEVIALNRSAHLNDIDANDESMAVFRYPHFDALIRANAVEPGGYTRRKLTVCGTKGSFEILPLERIEGNCIVSTAETYWPADKNGQLAWDNEGIHTVYPAYNRYDAMMLSFADMVRNGTENPYGYAYERELHQLIRKTCGF